MFRSDMHLTRRRFVVRTTMTAAAALQLRTHAAWASDGMDPRVAGIVASTIGIDTHNHVDVPMTAEEMQGRIPTFEAK